MCRALHTRNQSLGIFHRHVPDRQKFATVPRHGALAVQIYRNTDFSECLTELCSMSCKDALAAFAAARAPGIWDHAYIDELYARHGGGAKPGPEVI